MQRLRLVPAPAIRHEAALGVALGLALAATSEPEARADAAAGPAVRVVVEGEAGCTDAFFRDLAERVAPREVVRAKAGDPDVRVVRLGAADSGRAVGTVSRPDAGTSRAVEGATCEDVARGLSLVIAVADAEGGAPSAGGAEPEVAEPRPAAVETPPAPPAPRGPLARAGDEGARAEARGAPPGWRAGAALRVDATSLAPSPTIAPGASAWLERGVGREGERAGGAGWLAPRARARVAASVATQVDARSAGASFGWTYGGLDVCPVRARLGPVEARPCAGLDVGALRATPEAREGAPGLVERPARRVRPWVAARATLDVEVTIAGPLALEAEGGLLAPLTRDAFVFAPSEHVYRPAPALVGALGLAWRWP